MIEFLKERKIVIIILILVIILIGWKIYDSSFTETIETKENISSEKKEEQKENNQEEEMIIVHITGEVNKPGVVNAKEGSRIKDVIELAGGLTENADISDVNLAYVVEDGVKIRIPSNNDDEKEEKYITEDSGKGVIISDGNKEDSTDLIININNATQAEFENLPGIGPAIASRIIEYRNKNGKFKNIEDIKNVTGIGENKFEKIKNFLKIK